ncbi:MAG: radical SAM protein [archaeon]
MGLVRITRDSGIPLIGCIAFGIIDRGTNLIQVRPTSVCNLRCPFCSTNANDVSVHPNSYEVDLPYLVDWIKDIVRFKGEGVELNFDSVGEVLTYRDFVKLVAECSRIKGVSFMSMQTNGVLLTEKVVDDLEKAGIKRINLSMNTLNPDKARMLCGANAYDIKKVMKVAEHISKSKIELLIAPVWLPKVNDDDIEDIVKFAKSLDVKLGIQKYEIYKYGRKLKQAKHVNWWRFYKQLDALEKKYGTKLKLTRHNFKITKMPRLPSVFKKGDKISVVIKAPGWIKNQVIGVADNRCISINDCLAKVGDKVRVRIVEDKNELYVAEVL